MIQQQYKGAIKLCVENSECLVTFAFKTYRRMDVDYYNFFSFIKNIGIPIMSNTKDKSIVFKNRSVIQFSVFIHTEHARGTYRDYLFLEEGIDFKIKRDLITRTKFTCIQF